MNWDNGFPTATSVRTPPVLDPTFMNFQTAATQSQTSGQAGRIQN